mmetsp:Transcript_81808/g.231875  ORF Transcript_81808/g.231875 Transcript_81808/m.231875 type:complete len:456 (-) Transcript_81808:549-1916(-)
MADGGWAGGPTPLLHEDASWLGTARHLVPGLLALLLVEALFYLWYRVALRRAQAINAPPRLSLEERNFLLHKMLSHAEEYGMWRQVQGWFLNKGRDAMHSPHEVGQDDLKDLVAWAFFYKHVEDLDADERAWMDFACDKIHDDFNLDQSLRPGRTGVVPVRHTLDHIYAIHRPLLLYAVIHFLYLLHGWVLRLRGFQYGRHHGLRYWYRFKSRRPTRQAATCGEADAAASNGESEALAFFHGIGIGLALYVTLWTRFRQDDQIFFELPWISCNPFVRVPSSTEYSRWVVEALEAHGVDRCIAVGHSFGSLPVAWLIRQHPGKVSRCVLVDPVALFLNLPDVCVNFLYRQPRTMMGLVMKLFGAREFGIARTLMRHFFWTDSVLFPEMLPAHSSIILMGKDRVLPVRDIYTSAKKVPSLKVLVMEGLDHGHFLVWPSAVATILGHVDGRDDDMKEL